jgi:hypothetical protein
MLSGTLSRLLTPGLLEIWGLDQARRASEADQLFEMRSSSRNYEDIQGLGGLGIAPVKNEGDNILYDSSSQGWVKRFLHNTYAIGVALSQEAIEDNLYLDLAATQTKEISKSLAEAKAYLQANIFNNAFTNSSAYYGGDGVPLASSSHVYQAGGTYSNQTTAASLSEASLENMLITLDQFKTERGLPTLVKPTDLVVPPQLRHEARRILRSELQNDTANNAINAMRDQDYLQKPAVVLVRMTSSTNYFIKTDAELGLMYITRVPPSFDVDEKGDTDNYNVKLKGRMRVSVGWANPHTVVANAGA